MVNALLIEDDEASLRSLKSWIEREGYAARVADSLAEARSRIAESLPDLAIIDLSLPDGSGLELLDELPVSRETEVVVVTAHGSIDSAVEAVRRGAMDYLTKPIDVGRLKKILGSVRETRQLRAALRERREEVEAHGRFGSLVGSAPAMRRVYDLIGRVAPTDATVFLVGETGVGKELVAEAVHENSRRSTMPFLPLNCGAVSPTLIESELFGHERGSFTGATSRHRGIFERANGGTIFLDEVTEMPPELQVKLLRVLETGAFSRVGGTEMFETDVRVIAATNRDYHQAVREGKLREDLLYRLLVFPIEIPPLRQRSEDIELLANTFLARLNEGQETVKELTQAAVDKLMTHQWSGNVRELKNVVERAFILADENIGPDDLVLPSRRQQQQSPSGYDIGVGLTLAEAERRLLLATLEHCDGDKRKAAHMLGISLKTVYNRLHRYEEESSSGKGQRSKVAGRS